MKSLGARGKAVLGAVALFVWVQASAGWAEEAKNPRKVSFKQEPGRVEILVDGATVAKYVYDDPTIPRPYFCDIKTLSGVQVTRTNPPDPVADKGNDDHATFHPGAWLAFGDINGLDFWRNKARVKHVRFIEEAPASDKFEHFVVENAYLPAIGDDPICVEKCEYIIYAEKSGYYIVSRSLFSSDKGDFAFGDQEEMGFGVRIATPFTVKHGSGWILNSEGGKNEKGTWGKTARWCAAMGRANGETVGVCVMPSFYYQSWFHTRDYGLIVANQFGKKAMTAPDDEKVAPNSTAVKKDQKYVLGFGLYVFDASGNGDPNLNAAYQTFESLLIAVP